MLGGNGRAQVLLIGGGVVGLACALSLRQAGLRVTLVDQGSGASPSWGNAGHLAVEQVAPLASPAVLRSFLRRLFWRGGPLALPLPFTPYWLPFAFRFAAAARPAQFERGGAALASVLAAAIPAWRTLLDRVGASDLLREDGHFVLWETGDPLSRLAAWQEIDVGTARFEPASDEDLHLLRGSLAVRLTGGLRFRGSAQIIDLEALRSALWRHFRASGGELLEKAVVRIEPGASGAAAILEDGQRIAGDKLLVCAGIGSRPLLERIGHKVPLVAERGYHLHSASARWPSDLPPVIFEDRNVVLTRFRSGVRVTGFVEFAPPTAPPDPRKWQRLQQHVDELGIGMTKPARWMGARPTFPDYLPAIGRSSVAQNIFYAFGHQHLGLTLAAATGTLVADLIAGRAAELDLRPFALERFG